MNILIINTAFDVANYILVANEKVFEMRTDSNAKHSESSLVCIDNLLANAGITIREVDVVSVCVGAGSFTGIRIGVALAKGFMCANNNLKGVGFNCFEPLFEKVAGNGVVYVPSGKADYYVCECENGKAVKMYAKTVENQAELENGFVFDGVYETSALVKVTKDKIACGETCDSSGLEPLYLKLSQAEQELLKKENN